MSQARNLLEIWDLYSKQVLTEKAKAPKMNTKQGPKQMDLNDKKIQGFAFKNSGPAEASGLNKDIIDAKTPSKANKQYSFEVDKFTLTGENFDKNMEKTAKARINNNMNSIFDKLFEEVMDSNEQAADLDALGIGDEGAGDEGLDMGGEGGEVTVTLTPDQVECLRAILSQVDMDEGMGEEGLEDEGLEDMGDEDFGGEETDMDEDNEDPKDEDAEEEEEEGKKPVKESTINEANMKAKGKGGGKVKSVVDGKGKDLPDKVGLMTGKNNKVGDKTSSLSSKGKGPGEHTVGSTVDGKGTAVADSAGLGLTKHGSNKPHSKITGNNQEFFGV